MALAIPCPSAASRTASPPSTPCAHGSADPAKASDESALKLTIAQYLTPGDVSIQEVGVTPDVFVDANWWEFSEEDDPQQPNPVRDATALTVVEVVRGALELASKGGLLEPRQLIAAAASGFWNRSTIA